MKLKWNYILMNAICCLLLFITIGCASNQQSIDSNKEVVSRENLKEKNSDSKKTSEAFLSPLISHHSESRHLAKFINSYHVTKPELDNVMSEKILSSYLDSLDKNKHYFTQNDIDSLNSSYKHIMMDSILFGVLKPAFEIYDQYQKIYKKRYVYSGALLNDFGLLVFDKEELKKITEKGWPTDEAKRQSVWKVLVANDIDSLRQTGLSENMIKEVLIERYKNNIGRLTEITATDVFSHFMNAFANTVDPHTSYFPIRENVLSVSSDLLHNGIGIVIGIRGDNIEVIAVASDSPAEQSKNLLVGDKITTITQFGQKPINVTGKSSDDVIEMIKGEKGSVVHLSGFRDLTPFSVTLTRRYVKLAEPVVSRFVVVEEGNKIGVLKIPRFYLDFSAKYRGDTDYLSVSRDIQTEIEMMIEEGISGLVVDLSGNGGGSLDEVIKAAGVFVGNKVIAQEKNHKGNIDALQAESTAIPFDKPLVILVDQATAAGSEIFAAALQDYGRAIIVGQPTYGSGTIQRVIDLNNLIRSDSEMTYGALKLTISEIFRVNGKGLQINGITPDIILDLEVESEEREKDLKNALPASAIKPIIETSKSLNAIKIELNKNKNKAVVDVSNSELNSSLKNAIAILNHWILLEEE